MVNIGFQVQLISFIHPILFDLDVLTSYPVTLESTNVYNKTTFYTVDFISSAVSEAPNGTTSLPIDGILINLIKIFGGVDILLIFIYTVIFVIDRQREKNAYQTENSTSYTTRYNTMYENIEIDSFTQQLKKGIIMRHFPFKADSSSSLRLYF